MFEIDWATVRRQALNTLVAVLVGVVSYLVVAIPAEGEITFTWQGVWVAAVSTLVAFVRGWLAERKATATLNSKLG